jgi:Protein of unknown function (DUF3455)
LSYFLAAFRFSYQEPVVITKESDIMSAKFIGSVLGVVIAVGGATHAAAVERIPRPAVPGNLEVSLDYKLFLKVHAVGTQNYICAPAATATGVDWLFIGPQATLFNDSLQQAGTHYQSRNPQRNNAIQATWQDSGDTSAVWATRRDGSLDANYVAPGAIEWLVLDVSGAQLGPTAGNKLSPALIIQRVNTQGGVKPPSTECTPATLNTRKLVPYEADYYFYK